MRDDPSGLLIDRLAASIVDESLPLKDVEKELRGSVAELAVKKRGLGKREIASRCGVTEKSIDNYLKEARANPKSPEREIARLLQDGPLTLEEIYDQVRPVLSHGRYFSLDDAKRTLEKLIRTGEAEELPGKKYRGFEKPLIRVPLTVDAYRDLVDEKARDLDYVILSQKEVSPEGLPSKKTQQFSRVVGDTNLVRIDFTVDVPEGELPKFYEELSAEIARLTLKYEKKKGRTRLRIVIGMRTVALIAAALLSLLAFTARVGAADAQQLGRSGDINETWELDSRTAPPPGGGGTPAITPLSGGGEGAPSRKPPLVLRGDVTSDSFIDVSDVVSLVSYLLRGTGLACQDAADVNDDGDLDFADPVRLLRFLFAETPGSELCDSCSPLFPNEKTCPGGTQA